MKIKIKIENLWKNNYFVKNPKGHPMAGLSLHGGFELLSFHYNCYFRKTIDCYIGITIINFVFEFRFKKKDK